jgi:hypothetical protein
LRFINNLLSDFQAKNVAKLDRFLCLSWWIKKLGSCVRKPEVPCEMTGAKKPCKVWDAVKEKRKGIVASSFEEFRTKGELNRTVLCAFFCC